MNTAKLAETSSEILRQLMDKTPEAIKQYSAMKVAESVAWIVWGIFLLVIVAASAIMGLKLVRQQDDDFKFAWGIAFVIFALALLLPGAWTTLSAVTEFHNYGANPLGCVLDGIIKAAGK